MLDRKKARLNVCGYAEKKGKNYNKDKTVASIVYEITIRVILALILILRMIENVYDIKGAFLHSEFTNKRKMHIEVPKG